MEALKNELAAAYERIEQLHKHIEHLIKELNLQKQQKENK